MNTTTTVGMTTDPVSLDVLLETRTRLRAELPRRLTDNQRRLLTGLARAKPDWDLLQCPYAADLPALRWKLANLQNFQNRCPDDFESQATALEAGIT